MLVSCFAVELQFTGIWQPHALCWHYCWPEVLLCFFQTVASVTLCNGRDIQETLYCALHGVNAGDVQARRTAQNNRERESTGEFSIGREDE